MTKKEPDKLLESNYDDIKEYDNDLPKWWLYLFYFTILFSIAYTAYYHFGPGMSPHALLEEQMASLKTTQAEFKEADSTQTVALEKLVSEVGRIALGNKIYTEKCAACHGASGEGLIGPNLTDEYWIHGGTLQDIQNVIENGVLEKGMLAWKSQLSSDELVGVIAYVWSIRNNKVSGKEPQGDPVSSNS